jgi:16S rRNA processing protein RimM
MGLPARDDAAGSRREGPFRPARPEGAAAAGLDWDEMISVGRIARPHGNAGRVVINPDTDFAEERFEAGSVVYVRRGGDVESLSIRDVRFHRGRPIVGFDGVGTITDAEALANAEVRVPPEALGGLPAGTFYYHELIGCRVETVGGRAVWTVVSIEGGGEAHRLVIEGVSAEVQVPLVAPICVRIDPRERVIVLDPPEGLLDLNRSRPSRNGAG